MLTIGGFVKNFIEKNNLYSNSSELISQYFDAKEFFSNPVGFYPGSADDGFMIKILNMGMACRHFLYVDYMHFEKTKLIENFKSEAPGYVFRGYQLESIEDLKQESLFSGMHSPTVEFDVRSMKRFDGIVEGFAVLATFKRHSSDNLIGHDWFKVLIIGGDGIATYDVLFTEQNANYPPPLVVLIEDYGFGGNYDKFGRGGLLERIVLQQKRRPQFAIFGHTDPWNGYTLLPHVASQRGGTHNHKRSLYTLNEAG